MAHLTLNAQKNYVNGIISLLYSWRIWVQMCCGVCRTCGTKYNQMFCYICKTSKTNFLNNFLQGAKKMTSLVCKNLVQGTKRQGHP